MSWERQHVRDYFTRNAWTPPNFLRGVRVAISNNVLAERTLREWLSGSDNATRESVGAMLAFIDKYPEPGPFGQWEHEVATKGKQRVHDEDRAMQALRDAVVREREERRTALLAAERAPRKPDQPWCPSARYFSASLPA